MRFLASALPVIGSTVIAGTAAAAGLPPLAADERNLVPACATPYRLTAYLKSRNASLDPRFADLAKHYMREGRSLHIRWDYAFFQMIVETASLSFRRPDGQPARVRAEQNNFAGLGLMEKGNAPTSFADVRGGVRAHLERLVREGQTMRAASERRNEKAEGGTSAGFDEIAHRWAPDAPAYAASIERVARKFYDGFCEMSEPAQVSAAPAKRAPAKTAAVPPPSEPARIVKRPVEKVTVTAVPLAATVRATTPPPMPSAKETEPVSASAPDNAPTVTPVSAAPTTFAGVRPEDSLLTGRSSLGKGDPDAPEEPSPRFSLLSPGTILAALLPKSFQSAPEPAVAAKTEAEAQHSPAIPATTEPPTPVHKPEKVAVAPPAAPKLERAVVKSTTPKPKVQKAALPASPPAPAKPALPPADAALHDMVVGKVVHLDTPVGTVIPISYHDDGTMHGEAGSLAFYLGSRADNGKWWVAKGQLCQKWKVWFDRDQVCMRLKQVGRTVHWSADNGKSGTARIADGRETASTR